MYMQLHVMGCYRGVCAYACIIARIASGRAWEEMVGDRGGPRRGRRGHRLAWMEDEEENDEKGDREAGAALEGCKWMSF